MGSETAARAPSSGPSDDAPRDVHEERTVRHIVTIRASALAGLLGVV
jgi:hypothetical protein